MKSLIIPTLAAISFMTLIFCGLAAVSTVERPYKPHRFDHLNDAMWSAKPIGVDPSSQNFERLAAVVADSPSSQDLALLDPQPQQATSAVATLPDHTAPMLMQSQTDLLCRQKYHSYRASDNTYQTFDRGPRRKCELSPDVTHTASTLTGAEYIKGSTSPADHGAWCSARYSSYDPTTDTYQPFNGGGRKHCASPMSVASN